MKRYRRFIQSSTYIDQNRDVVLDDHIIIEIDMDLPVSILSSTSTQDQIIVFPGVEDFRKDVLHILEEYYGFDVIEDVYNGVKQKGYCSDRDDSISIYFDTYFDISKSRDVIKRVGIPDLNLPSQGIVYCFIHLRFSDHTLADSGDELHIQFIKENTAKYTSNKPNLYGTFGDENIEIPEKLVYRYYNQALEYLKDELDMRICTWVKKINKYGNLLNN